MSHPRVLVVDDDSTTCTLLSTILSMENYETVSVQEVQDDTFIPLLEEHRPDVVILDFHLGAKESLKYLHGIRADEQWHALPVFITSAIDRKQASVEAGATGFILKPFNWQEVHDAVGQALNAVSNGQAT